MAPNQGRGAAVGYRLNGGGSGSSATINVNANGTINLITGSVDIGGTRSSIAMQAAEVLGIGFDDVNPTVVDTDSVGYTGGTNGSRITFDTGRAAINAAELVIGEMSRRAALLWEVQPEDVDFADGVFVCSKNPEDRFTFRELAAKLMDTGGPVTCSASDRQGGVGPQLAGTIVDVEVDPETGKVDILRCTVFLDCGKAVYPSYVEGQMQGGRAPGVRLGSPRGVLHDRGWHHGQLQLPRLPDAHQPGPAHDRLRDNRGAQQPPPRLGCGL